MRDSSVTVVLAGTETRYRKHVDWEIYSSMYNGARNKKFGILVVNLPSVNGSQISMSYEDKPILGPELKWSPITSYERYEYLPARIIDNVKSLDVKIAIVDYTRIVNNPEGFMKLIDIAYMIFVQLGTRKISVEFDENDDVISEVYDSWYSVFQAIREMLMGIRPTFNNKELIDIGNKILNVGMRPHPTKWQAKFIKWYAFQLENRKTMN